MTSNPNRQSRIGLDIDPEDDVEYLFSQPLPSPESIDPSLTDNPVLRELQIEVRRLHGLADYPDHSDIQVTPRSAAD